MTDESVEVVSLYAYIGDWEGDRDGGNVSVGVLKLPKNNTHILCDRKDIFGLCKRLHTGDGREGRDRVPVGVSLVVTIAIRMDPNFDDRRGSKHCFALRR